MLVYKLISFEFESSLRNPTIFLNYPDYPDVLFREKVAENCCLKLKVQNITDKNLPNDSLHVAKR